jgi:hypothetical protein
MQCSSGIARSLSRGGRTRAPSPRAASSTGYDGRPGGKSRPHLATVVARLNRRPRRVYVMGQRTKWGNCSSQKNLSFNWRLILAPDYVLRYLVPSLPRVEVDLDSRPRTMTAHAIIQQGRSVSAHKSGHYSLTYGGGGCMNDRKARHRAEVKWACGPLALFVSLRAFEYVNKTSDAATYSVACCSSTSIVPHLLTASLPRQCCDRALATRYADGSRI